MSRPCICDRGIKLGEPWDASQCNRCWLWHHRAEARERWGGKPADCVHPHTPRPNPAPLSLTRLDGSRLINGTPASHVTGHSNASIIRWQGRLLLAYRHRWSGADVYVTVLDDDTYQPKSKGTRIELRHHHSQYGTDDPRLFVHQGRLHVSFVGVEGKLGPSSQLFATLNDEATAVERITYLDIAGRDRWEKNINCFSHDGTLYAVYSISPHVILRVHPVGRCERVHETPTPHDWSGGIPRGGASPVRVSDEYFHWFHGKVKVGGILTYTTGCYTFEAKPPFRVTRMMPTPAMHGDSRTRPASWRINNWFPCGAILEDSRWVVSAGAHDQWIEIAEWDAQDVCRRLLTPNGAKAAKPCGCH